MAAADDKASITMDVSLLPLELRKIFTSASMEYTPANNSESWYSKIITISDGTTGNTADSIYLTVDASAPACTDELSIEIGPGESWFCKMNVPATNIHVTSDPKGFPSHGSSTTIQCYVAAIIGDKS